MDLTSSTSPWCHMTFPSSPSVTVIAGTLPLEATSVASPVRHFFGEPLPPTCCLACPPLHPVSYAIGAATPHPPTNRCRTRRHTWLERGDHAGYMPACIAGPPHGHGPRLRRPLAHEVRVCGPNVGPVAHQPLFSFFFIRVNFRNSYKSPKFIEDCLNNKKIQSKLCINHLE
jgi:hypothetical protein